MVRTIQGSWLPLALVASALVALAAWAAIAGTAHAQSASVGSANVPPGGSGSVDVTVEAPSSGLSTWTIDIAYDSSVVDITDCDTSESPGLPVCNPSFQGEDVVRVAGADTSNPTGTLTMASLAFDAVGEEGDCTDLTVTAVLTDADSEEVSVSTTDGEICIQTPTPTPTEAPTPTPTEAPTEAPTPTPTASPGGLPDTGGSAGGSSNTAAYLLGILGLAVVGSGVFAVTRIRNSA